MAKSYFILEKGIIERDDLTIYEKMCCVVLAKWAAESVVSFDMATLAIQMSCTENKAKETIEKLKYKGFIESEGKEETDYRPPRIIKAEHVDGLEPLDFSEKSDQKMTKEDLVAKIHDLIDEPINDSEARIILNFANENFEKIEFCYKKAKKMQVSDKIEALMMELQKKEVHKVKVVEAPVKDASIKEAKLEKEEIKKDEPQCEKLWYLDGDEDGDIDVIKPPSGNQINTNMLNKMKAYGKLRK